MLPLADLHLVDLTDARGTFGVRLLRRLGAAVVPQTALGIADAVILTGTPSALARRGQSPAVLLERHPRLIVAVISPFGLGGPRAEWAISDTVAQAIGGMLHVNGHAHEAPLRGLGAQAYHSAGLQAAIGVVLAVLARRHSGRGQLVDVSVLESTVAALEHVTATYRETGVPAARQGTLHWTGTFHVAECRDGPVVLSHLGDWTALVEWVAADGMAGDLIEPRWADSELRRRECAHVFDVLAAWAARYCAEELVEEAQLRRLPFAPVWPLRQVVDHPQLHARGFFERDETGMTVRSGGPFQFSAILPSTTPQPAAVRPGRVGERAGALQGVRVLDFTWVVAGPVATRVLADHGADVIKVERLDAPDGAQRRGGLFGNLNRGKRSIAVDLSDPRGVALVRELARRSDVVIDNFSPRVLANWGLDHASLHALEPRLVVLSLSGFGRTGPFADRVSYGPTLQAQTGFTWHMRHPGGAPAGWGFSYSDMASGYCGALAVLAALSARGADGAGCAIDLAQLEVLAMMLGPLLDAALSGATVPDGFGNRSPDETGAPDGVYRCRDEPVGRERWCAITARGDDEWRRFSAAIGAPSWTGDARFATVASRRAHADELDRLVASWTSPRSAADVMQRLQGAGIAAGLVADGSDLAADPQLAARGYWAELPGGVQLDGVVPLLSATPGAIDAPGPRLGEHTDEVLHELLAMEHSAIARLRTDGVIH